MPMSPVDFQKLSSQRQGETSETIRQRVELRDKSK